MDDFRNRWHRSTVPEETLVEAVGRACGYVIGCTLRHTMVNNRLRARAWSLPDAIRPHSSPTLRHPIGQVRRMRSTSRLLLPQTRVHNEHHAEELSRYVFHLLHSVPEHPYLREETCGVFEELVTNAVQHSNLMQDPDDITCFTALEYSSYRNQRLLTVSVYDNGIGLQTLKEKSDTAPDHHLLLGATGFGITGTAAIRGVGLNHTSSLSED